MFVVQEQKILKSNFICLMCYDLNMVVRKIDIAIQLGIILAALVVITNQNHHLQYRTTYQLEQFE